MKYVQIAILALMVLVAGLLVQIYRTQEQPNTADPTVSFEEPAASDVAEPIPVLDPPEDLAAKPSPVRVRPKPAPPAEPVAAASPPAEEHQPQAAAVIPEPAPPAVEPRAIEPAEYVPAPPPEPRRFTVAAGTTVAVRLNQYLSTERNLGGDTFYASLDEPLVVDDYVVAERGARVEGRVVDVERAGRVKGLSKLSIELVRLKTRDGQTVAIVTDRIHRQGEKSKGDDAKKVGIGAGIGAIIGAIAGGGKGAAIGAGAGAGAGGGVAAATRGKPVEMRSETRLKFQLMDPVEIVEKL